MADPSARTPGAILKSNRRSLPLAEKPGKCQLGTITCSNCESDVGMVEIRSEQPEDHHEIHRLTSDAFAGLPYSDGTEPTIIDSLRAAGDLTLSLVAMKSDALVGHVAFSPVCIGTCTSPWYGLGPISVRPDLQRTGIGSALIIEGLRILEGLGAVGCVLIGDPKYYCRFGFISDGSIQYQDLPDEYVQWKSFGSQRPEGLLIYSPAFGS